MKHIVSFSGGKDSTGMLLKMYHENMPIDEIIFIDSTVEFPEIYEHIQKEIIMLKAKYSYEYYLGEYKKKDGSIGYGHPDFKNRWCTQLLKKDVIKKYLAKYKGQEITEYHGIAYDEQN